MCFVDFNLAHSSLEDYLWLSFPLTGESVTLDSLPLNQRPLETWWREWTSTSSTLRIVSYSVTLGVLDHAFSSQNSL